MNETIDRGLHTRFLRGLAAAPDGVAIRVGADLMSYAAVHERALTWAGALSGEPVVGVLAEKGVLSYVGVLAGLYAGATVVPLPPSFPRERIRQMLAISGVSAVIADASGVATLAEAGPAMRVLAPEHAALVEPGLRVPLGAALTRPISADPVATAYVLFTSGSTGRPKAVPITHASTEHYFRILDRRYDFGADDVFSQTFDLNFDCAMFDLFCAWGAGAAVHAVPAQAYRKLPQFFAERGVSVWFSTPSAIALVRRLGGLAPGALPTLRWSLFAGEALRCADADDWQVAAPHSIVENLYGPTELTVTIAAHRWSGGSDALAVNGVVPIGAIHDGHDYLLLDGTGDEGELCVAGPQLTPGYLDPADNDGRFLERSGRTWYRTGDRVRRLGNGELAYLGRLDSQIQVQGWRVELGEVEHAVRGCAGVTDAVAVAAAHDGGTELVVFYTGARVPAVELARQARRRLPHGMVPREFRYLDEFPLNTNRKVDRARLSAMAADNSALGVGHTD
ncbi:amino acid adenylation domain-containing protein [Nocardia tenerifensis]|uniref:Amino acid adenylation domain-containing protein n=1 Tax=Nocardia tenerifensis TaxID=228006 RepID=A0A318KA81_9NOCA|nr:AMP-binding protein [Nocardia tenerifensis]PXX71471.1 amino acid adenylation domain-containing protein [Nocardia tenerifensis]